MQQVVERKRVSLYFCILSSFILNAKQLTHATQGDTFCMCPHKTYYLKSILVV